MEGVLTPEIWIAVAEKAKIPYQLTVLQSGRTDGGEIHLHLTGVPSIFIATPSRYIHSHASLVHLDDFENAVKLTLALLSLLDRKTVDGLTA